jgi:Zn-dependent protease with chaperone function
MMSRVLAPRILSSSSSEKQTDNPPPSESYPEEKALMTIEEQMKELTPDKPIVHKRILRRLHDAKTSGESVYCYFCGMKNPKTRPFCRDCKMNLNTDYNLPSSLYETSETVSSLNRLMMLGPVNKLMDLFLNKLGTPWVEAQLMGNAVKMSEKQFPDLYEMAIECAAVLAVDRLPKIYVTNFTRLFPDPENETFTIGSNTDPVIITSASITSRLSSEEFKFEIGREMGHIKCGHPQVLALAQMIKSAAASGLSFGVEGLGGDKGGALSKLVTGIIGSSLVDQPLTAALNAWYRSANYTADMAGLVAIRDIEIVKKYFAKMLCGWTWGALASRLNFDEVLEQSDELEGSIGRFSEFLGPLGDSIGGPLGIPVEFNPGYTMPFTIKRFKALRYFHESKQFKIAEKRINNFLAGKTDSALEEEENKEIERLTPISLTENSDVVYCGACGQKIQAQIAANAPCPYCGSMIQG